MFFSLMTKLFLYSILLFNKLFLQMQRNFKKSDKQKDKEKKKEEPRYNEKQAFITHLSSENGITKLLNTFRSLNNKNADPNIEGDVTMEKIKKDPKEIANQILDIFKAWVDEFPCKKFYSMSYYEIFSKIEKYCEEKEIYEMFDYIN